MSKRDIQLGEIGLTPEAAAKARARIRVQLKLAKQARERAKRVGVDLPKLYTKQNDIKEESRRFNVLDIGRRAGKTYLGVHLALEAASQGKLVGWFSPTYKYLLDVWRDLERPVKKIAVRVNATERRIELPNGGLIECWTLENVDAGRGRKYHLAVIDEAAVVTNLKESFEQSIRPTLTDFQGNAWFLSTPKGLNYFHELFLRGMDSENFPLWKSWQLPSAVNPYLPKGEIEEARKSLPELVFRQEYLAEFITSDGAVFRGVDGVLTAKETTPGAHKGHFVVAGVDWGRSHDFTAISVFCCHCGAEVDLDRFNQVGWEFQRGKLLAIMEKWGVKEAIIETNSIGGPNLEALRKVLPSGVYARGFDTNSKTKPKLILDLAVCIEQSKAKWLPHLIARHELVAYEAEVLQSGYTRYGAPEGGHDDTVIARALVWHSAKARYPYPQSFGEEVEGKLPVGWRAGSEFGEPGSWERDAWEMARGWKKGEIEKSLKARQPDLDNPWEPVGGLTGLPDWHRWE